MTRALRGLTLMLLALCAGSAQAHTTSVSHVDIGVPADGGPVRIELDLSIRDLALSLPVDRNRDERVTWGELSDARGDIERLIAPAVVLSTPQGACGMDPAGFGIRRYDDGAYATVLLDAHCPAARRLRLDYRLFLDRDPQHRGLVTLRSRGMATTAIARGEPLSFDVALERSHAFVDYLREGVHHILIGYDHLAFLLSLLLPAVLVRRDGRWQPVASRRESLAHVLGIVTAFTVAHSVTLSLAALGLVRPASAWVESAIAASVLLAALNNVRPLVSRRLWAVGFVFGLVHGFGFAGALGELGLPAGARLTALVGFNLGVEAGQLTVVALVLPVLLGVRRSPAYARIAMPAVSLLIAALAAWWLWMRLPGLH